MLKLLLSLISAHNDCILQDFKAALTVSIEDLKPVREMLCEFILKETLDPKGNFYSAFYKYDAL
jgi:hypothetical protein